MLALRSRKNARSLVALTISSKKLLMVSACTTPKPQNGNDRNEGVRVLAGKTYYSERPEAQTLWFGTLEQAQRGGAPLPNQRAGLYYRLVTEKQTYDI